MSQEKIGGGDVIKFADYLERKAARDAKPKPGAQQVEIPPLTDGEVLNQARVIAARFSSIKSLAKDIDRQQNKLGQIPNADNLERARADYLNELRQARQLETDKLEGVIKNMFAGYSEEQTVFLNSKYVAYARAYLEMVDSKHKLPDME